MLNTPSLTSSLLIPTTPIQEGDESPTSDTPIEDIPFWARGHLRQKSPKYRRPRKTAVELADTSVESLAGRDPGSKNSQGPLGGLFRRGNSSQAAIQTNVPEQQRHSSDETLSRDYSSRSLPEVRIPGMADDRPSLRRPQPASETHVKSSYSMRVRRHEREVSNSSVSLPRDPPPPPPPYTPETKTLLHQARSQSLQLPSVSFSSPLPALNGLNSLGSIGGLNDQYKAKNANKGHQVTVAVQQKRIEDMTEEEMIDLALRESAATAQPPASPEYETPPTIISRSISDTSSSIEATYTTSPSQARNLPYMGEITTAIVGRAMGGEGNMNSQSMPWSNEPTTGNQFNVELRFRDLQGERQYVPRLANPENMTEEEMVEKAIIESLKVS